MRSVVFSLKKEVSFPETYFNNVSKLGLSYKIGIGLFWVIVYDNGTKTYLNHRYFVLKRINDKKGGEEWTT